MKKIKEQLYAQCLHFVDQQIEHAKQALDASTESGNDETKSSAGDKHETGKAMAQLEQEKNGKQLSQALNLKVLLERINPNQKSAVVALGSIVITNNGNFYISIGASKMIVEKKVYFAISPTSPIASQLMGKAKGEEIKFNSLTYKIEMVC